MWFTKELYYNKYKVWRSDSPIIVVNKQSYLSTRGKEIDTLITLNFGIHFFLSITIVCNRC